MQIILSVVIDIVIKHFKVLLILTVNKANLKYRHIIFQKLAII